MATRHKAALDCMRRPKSDLRSVAATFIDAIDEAQAQELDPTADAAVMLIGMKLAFLVHADVGGPSMIRPLMEMCGAEAATPILIREEQST